MMWFFMIHFDFGVLNVLQRQLGGNGINYLGENPNALLTIVAVEVWRVSNSKGRRTVWVMADAPRVPLRVENFDRTSAQTATIDYSKLDGFDRQNTLFFEFHGSPPSVEEQANQVKEISDEFGGTSFRWTTSTEERNALWQARHDAYYAILAMQPGKFAMSTDVCVPISRLAETILETQEDLISSGFAAPILGHVGDGNFHSVFLVDLDDAEEVARAKQTNERMVHRALAKGGTCTGEHGVGVGKQDYLVAEHGEAVSIMRLVKNALDPDNIMNPGKILRV